VAQRRRPGENPLTVISYWTSAPYVAAVLAFGVVLALGPLLGGRWSRTVSVRTIVVAVAT
jgi:hypothetical protein